MELGNAIRNLREAKGLSLAKLAREAHVTEQYLKKIEDGQELSPSLDVLEPICIALELTSDQLFSLINLLSVVEERELRPLDLALLLDFDHELVHDRGTGIITKSEWEEYADRLLGGVDQFNKMVMPTAKGHNWTGQQHKDVGLVMNSSSITKQEALSYCLRCFSSYTGEPRCRVCNAPQGGHGPND